MFKENDYVVYKKDVCKIKEIKNKNENRYYILNPIDDDSLIIDVPIDNKMGFLRKIISKEEANNLIDNIINIMPLDDIDDKNIENKYKTLLLEGTHENFVKVIKTTYLRNEKRIKNNKKISEKDDTFFKKAEKYLYNELSISLNMTIPEVKDYIYKKIQDNM